jgi:hypothetical protein
LFPKKDSAPCHQNEVLFFWKPTGLLTVLLILLPVLAAFSLEKMEALWGDPEPHNRSQPRRGYSRPKHKWMK